jgi:hypothetical protein
MTTNSQTHDNFLVNNQTRNNRGEFNIEITFGEGSNGLNQQMADAVIEAAQFWENAITRSSFNGNHTLNIEVGGEVQAEDVLASASITEVGNDVNGNLLPTMGVANINTNPITVESLSHDPEFFTRIMIHEFGHVMGLGSLWSENNLIDPTTATYDANTNAGIVYGELLGLDTPTAIPLTHGEGEGSDLSHWDEEVFSNELLTHEAEDPGVSMPLSLMSLASLQDLGWSVDYSVADFYPDGFTGPETAYLTTGATTDSNSGCGCGFCAGCNNDPLSNNLMDAIAIGNNTF